ncbi:LysR substrate-binding domain-containing protein [Agrobacterium sp. ST15.13.013]|uniref:LysR substrate-binding domain-containing protein n=1 Tax=Agrobacterium sp. ST15.13.013 TaxID=3020525 RepID=UPI002300EBEB|nr:LysR substrate-binding domain-containing protein [Agrobacterium sp. ST15.13.013]MDA5641337.1 LysR substrate-binding domain-containing protein [Agrobacterium sp. ST15.13.013]
MQISRATSDCGLAYVTRWMAEEALADGRLRQALAEWTPPYPGLCLYYPRHRHIGAGMRAFLDFLRANRSI